MSTRSSLSPAPLDWDLSAPSWWQLRHLHAKHLVTQQAVKRFYFGPRLCRTDASHQLEVIISVLHIWWFRTSKLFFIIFIFFPPLFRTVRWECLPTWMWRSANSLETLWQPLTSSSFRSFYTKLWHIHVNTLLHLNLSSSISPSSSDYWYSLFFLKGESPLYSWNESRSPDITGTSSGQTLVFVIHIFLYHLVIRATCYAMGSSVVVIYLYSTQLKTTRYSQYTIQWVELHLLLISLPDVQGLQQKISRVVGFLNCRGHNSNFRVVQVETVQKISRACRPLSRQTSESLYKKAENELLIFVLFSPLHPTTLSRSSLPLTYSPLVLSCQSLNEGQHRFPRRCHRDAQKEYGNCYFSFLPLSFFSEWTASKTLLPRPPPSKHFHRVGCARA